MISPLAPIFLIVGFTIPMQADVSYYCNCDKCCGIYAGGLTASGTVPEEGRTIAAGQQFAFGTEIEINGNVYIVEDRGSAIKGNKIDVFMDSHSECLKNGRHTETVYIKIAPLELEIPQEHE